MAAANDGDHAIRLWDPATGRHLRTVPSPGRTGLDSTAQAIAAGGRLSVYGSGDKTDEGTYVWDMATGPLSINQSRQKAWAGLVHSSPAGVLLH